MGGIASSDVDSSDVAAVKTYDMCMVKVRAHVRRATVSAARL